MDLVFSALALLGPLVVGIVTVPVFNAIKDAAGFIDGTPAWVKQILVTVVAVVLTFVGKWVGVALPGDLAVFAASDVQALLSAAVAMAIHAGTKRRA